MNLREIMADNFKVFSKMGDESRLKNIEAIQYIDTIANTTGIDISGWDLHDVFARRGNTFMTDPTEINRAFFSHHEALIAAQPVQVGSLAEEVQKKIDEFAARAVARRIEEYSQKREAELSQAREYYRMFEAKVSAAYKYTLDMNNHARERLDLAHQIMTLQAESFWTNAVVDGKFLYLVTSNNVINIHRNAAAGVDLRVDLGKFAARLDLETMNLKVLPFTNNIMANNHFHPHVNGSGDICWGNGKDAAIKSLAKGDILSAYRLLASILCNYNDQNPYVALGTFSTTSRPIDISKPETQPEIMRHELRRREAYAK